MNLNKLMHYAILSTTIIFTFIILIGVISTVSGFVASPSYLKDTIFIEYTLALLIWLRFSYLVIKSKQRYWLLLGIPVISLLFARSMIGAGLPFILNSLANQKMVTHKFVIESKERIKRCGETIQLTANIDFRVFDHFNLCKSNTLNFQQLNLGQSIVFNGKGSYWGFYPNQHHASAPNSVSLKKIFAQYSFNATFVFENLDGSERYFYYSERAKTRLAAASTYLIPNT